MCQPSTETQWVLPSCVTSRCPDSCKIPMYVSSGGELLRVTLQHGAPVRSGDEMTQPVMKVRCGNELGPVIKVCLPALSFIGNPGGHAAAWYDAAACYDAAWAGTS